MRHFLLAALVLAFASGCEAHERNWLFDGEWIDVDGWGREADETCAGTFEYLDAYSGMVAAEFGVDEPLGVFQWSSWAHFHAGDLPCSSEQVACAKPGEAHSPLLPDEHEVVHLANYVAGSCPHVLAEGLAVYYETLGVGSASGDLDLLAARLARPDEKLPMDEYAIAGRFAAFLVHEFGLAKVLDVCSLAGRRPKAARLSSAMKQILGASPTELVEQLASEPEECNEFSRYQARLYACGEDPLAPHAGVVESGVDFRRTFSLGCQHPAAIGPSAGDIRFFRQLEFAEAGPYRVRLTYADGSLFGAPHVWATLAKCGYCGMAETFHASPFGYDFELEAGRYWLEFLAPADLVDPIELTITRL
jgi:hypothetical protein